MIDDVTCPYCGQPQEINHDDGEGYAEDQIHQQECSDCEKSFVFTTAVHFSYDAKRADCLNGGEHRFKKTTTIPKEFARLRCEDCWHEKPLPKPSHYAGCPAIDGKPVCTCGGGRSA